MLDVLYTDEEHRGCWIIKIVSKYWKTTIRVDKTIKLKIILLFDMLIFGCLNTGRKGEGV